MRSEGGVLKATTTHAADGRQYNERDYIDRTIATIRQHDPNALREHWWTGAALALADEIDRLRGKETAPDPEDQGERAFYWEATSLGTKFATRLEEDEKPFRDEGYPAGPVSMGGGRKLNPEFDKEGRLSSGTVFKDCPNSPDGYHHFTAVSNVQSVEHFVCDYCPKDWWD